MPVQKPTPGYVRPGRGTQKQEREAAAVKRKAGAQLKGVEKRKGFHVVVMPRLKEAVGVAIRALPPGSNIKSYGDAVEAGFKLLLWWIQGEPDATLSDRIRRARAKAIKEGATLYMRYAHIPDEDGGPGQDTWTLSAVPLFGEPNLTFYPDGRVTMEKG